LREVDARDVRASPGESNEIDACPAPHLENRAATIAVERNQVQEVMELLEVVFVEVVEESARADRVLGDLEIVNVPFPVRSDFVRFCHAG
jgi:hypothetical protein